MTTDNPRVWEDVIPEADRAIYASAGFGHPSGLGRRPAVLIIDVQYRTVGPRGPIEEAIATYPTAVGDAGWAAVDKMQELLRVARRSNVTVIYPYVAPKTQIDRGRLADKVPAIMTVDPRGYDFVEEAAPQAEDILLPKRHPSAFFGTPLASHLIEREIDTLIVAGCTTSGCVRSTVVDAFAFNFKVCVVEDCVYDRSEVVHKVNLFDMDSKYADVQPFNVVLEYLEKIGERNAVDSAVH